MAAPLRVHELGNSSCILRLHLRGMDVTTGRISYTEKMPDFCVLLFCITLLDTLSA